MTESSYPRVRRSKANRRARGERPIEVWVPISDPRAAEKVRDLANRLCKAAQAQQDQSPTNTEGKAEPP